LKKKTVPLRYLAIGLDKKASMEGNAEFGPPKISRSTTTSQKMLVNFLSLCYM
jgi:hypothetical protein